MSKGGLEEAVGRFNRALGSLDEAAQAVRVGDGSPSALTEELERLRAQRARLVDELEQVQSERARDADRRNDVLRRLDESIAELRRILGQ